MKKLPMPEAGIFFQARTTGRSQKWLPPEPVSAVNLAEWQQYQAECAATLQEQPKIEKFTSPESLKVRQQEERQRVLPDCTEAQQLDTYLAAVNADRVRVTCLRMMENGSRKAFILDKQDGATRGFTPEELHAHIPTMLRLQQRGENIYYTPLSEERHHILIDDMTRESMEKLYADGFRPAVVLESSPGNYQCVLTIPKLQGPHNREVGNRLAERLNREYGDKKLSGCMTTQTEGLTPPVPPMPQLAKPACVITHRAPGFANFKPKHRTENGAYPRVKLLQAEKRECAKALQLSRRIAQELAGAETKKLQTQPPRPLPTASRPGDTAAAYYAHFADVRKHLTIEDSSRVDAMIAVRLRATGHSQEAVAATIRQCAPTIRNDHGKRESRDWHRYAERTAAYAFSVAGDVALARNERYMEQWRKLEGMGGAQQGAQPIRLRT